MNIITTHQQYLQTALYGRYIHRNHIAPLLQDLRDVFTVTELGTSENELSIDTVQIGSGPKKIVMWSQMHGNESTTTKALFDLFQFLSSSRPDAEEILRCCTLYCIPILNPDGALQYTRVNYNKEDLNRDAQQRSQKETRLLLDYIDTIQPDFAFNLHGQRTIFSAGPKRKSATLSFLSPAGDHQRALTESRQKAMEIIAYLNSKLQVYLPGQIGRYDDGFNKNCVGDTLEMSGIPTLLYEAGHYDHDYEREHTRKFVFGALILALQYIARNRVDGAKYQAYFNIPENEKRFFDIIIKNVRISETNTTTDVALQYEEVLDKGIVRFLPKIAKIDTLDSYFGHREIDGKNGVIRSDNDRVQVVEGNTLLKFSINGELFSTDLIKK